MVDVQAYLDSMSAEILARTDVLPQARLEQLAQHGVILSVMTFEDHMNPQVHWIEPEEFGIAFYLLTERERPMPEAAYTKPGTTYPGYVNIQRDEAGAFIVTARGDPVDGKCGETVRIAIDEDDFYQLMANTSRLQPSVPTPVAEIEPVIEELAEARTEEEPIEEEPIEEKPIPEDVVHEPDAIVVDQVEGDFKGDAWPGAKPDASDEELLDAADQKHTSQ